MAKNQKQTYISPKKFMQTKARTLPIGKCYVNDGWEENGFAIVVVTRIRPSGNLVYGQFLVDTYCLGVKDAFFVENTLCDRLTHSFRADILFLRFLKLVVREPDL